MILLDSNIIVDLLSDSVSDSARWSHRAYADTARSEIFVGNYVVVAEVAAGAARPREILDDFARLQVQLLPLSLEGALSASAAFSEYRRRGGRRKAILADFLIAGHAAALGATLVTRDRRLASYFPGLSFITPETHPHV